ncbi:alpha/beta hydrolase [Halalkalirubrum salinum]|uniref:alpha/beta hydrolase n=1 Tax=Halalkalirubrum salinum TaxID=2563889 RepID=UPI0010FBB84A|nr:alpha/beta hydrolase [Halalkalirubrum salinum]
MERSLDPELAEIISTTEAAGIPPWHALSVDAARGLEGRVFAPEVEPTEHLRSVRDLAFEGPDGEVPVRIYRPEREDPAPTIVYFHGGGWTLGTLDSIDTVCRRLASAADSVVISVDYRLAPEHPFPAPLNDAVAAIEWADRHASTVGGDPDRLAVAGTSAGGNLAAATCLHAREFDGPTIDAQVLLYPITGRVRSTRSYERNADGPLLTRADMTWFFEQYCRDPVDSYNPFVSPLDASDLSKLPPAVVVTAGFDPLRDDGKQYADRLDAAAVPVTYLDYPTMVHGFLSLAQNVETAADAFDEVVQAFDSAIEIE